MLKILKSTRLFIVDRVDRVDFFINLIVFYVGVDMKKLVLSSAVLAAISVSGFCYGGDSDSHSHRYAQVKTDAKTLGHKVSDGAKDTSKKVKGGAKRVAHTVQS